MKYKFAFYVQPKLRCKIQIQSHEMQHKTLKHQGRKDEDLSVLNYPFIDNHYLKSVTTVWFQHRFYLAAFPYFAATLLMCFHFYAFSNTIYFNAPIIHLQKLF